MQKWIFSIALLIAGLTTLPKLHAKSIKEFGAVGDGRTDDTLALQNAVNQSAADLTFPPGVYRITSTIKINLDEVGFASLQASGAASILMSGAGPAIHFLGTHGGSADPGQFEDRVWKRQRMPTVRGLEIVGDHVDADGIEATGVMQLSLDGVLIRECRHGVHLTVRNRNVLISNCHIYHNRGCGIYYDNVNLHQSNIVGCHISYCAQGGVVIRSGEVRNVHIGTCDIESNMSATTDPTANVLIDCTNGSTDEVAITGCTLQHNSKSPGSANIRVLGKGVTSSRNPVVTQEGHIAITGNVFSDVMVNIHLQDTRGVSIVGNTFWEGFEHDLLIENSQAIVLGPNDFDRNPRYVVNGNWAKDLGGVTLRNCTDCKLNGLLIKGVWRKEAAVLLEKCTRTTLHDLSVLDCDGIGILLKDCVKVRVSDCMVEDGRTDTEHQATASLVVDGGTQLVLRDNQFSDGVVAKNGAKVEE